MTLDFTPSGQRTLLLTVVESTQTTVTYVGMYPGISTYPGDGSYPGDTLDTVTNPASVVLTPV